MFEDDGLLCEVGLPLRITRSERSAVAHDQKALALEAQTSTACLCKKARVFFFPHSKIQLVAGL